jgi:hypothetical protein
MRKIVSSTAFVAAIAFLAAACGGGGDDGSAPVTTADSSVTAAPTTELSGDPTSTTAAPTTAAPTTAAPTTTAAPPAARAFDLSTLPDLVHLADEAHGNPAIAPLEVAQQIIGFGYDIPSPDGSSLHSVSASTFGGSEDSVSWTFNYETVAADGVVEDVDITLEGSGPGAVALSTHYDPIMAALGFGRNGSTGSDPGDPGGPNSLNHVYPPEHDRQVLNGVPGRIPNVKIWVNEDINGGSYSDDVEIAGGYAFDYSFQVAPGVIPVPLLAGLADALPLPEGAVLDDARIRLHRRSEGSFSIELGNTYLQASLEWLLPDGGFDPAVAMYADTTVFTDPTTLAAAEPSFFNEGQFEPTEMGESFEGRMQIGVLLLERYEGRLTVLPATDDGDAAKLRLEVDLNPNVTVLAPPEE